MADIGACAVKGLTYQFMTAQSLAFGKTGIKRISSVVEISASAEMLSRDKRIELIHDCDFHENKFSNESTASGDWADDPGLDIHNIRVNISVTEYIEET
jgi:hypothetical protein